MNYTQEQAQKWDRVVQSLRNGGVSPQVFNLWVKPLKLYAVTDKEVLVINEDPNAVMQFAGHAIPKINTWLKMEFGSEYTLRILDPSAVLEPKRTTLNARYTFDNFVVGSSNNFAYAASVAVAEQPNDAYNPLFIYGDVGLGKTHLMNAIGNYILDHHPTYHVLLTTSENFTNELIEKIQLKQVDRLRDKMRGVDVLMVDDIQFLGKTTVSQEEFFHTFNDLYNSNKQIIISSDRPPQELPALEKRLRSRFNSGLIVDISKPDFETRVAILNKKAEEDFIDLPYEAATYIAEHFDNSIRELEGALTRVAAQSRLMGYPITTQLVIQTLNSMGPRQSSREIHPRVIIDTVAETYNVSPDEILSKKRSQDIMLPRQIAIYICREMTDLSTVHIGREFGGRDHTTILHSIEKVTRQMEADAMFRKRVENIMDALKNR